MYLQNIIKTFFSKTVILLLNFLMVVLTTHLWGAEGRGVISILIADMAIISIFNNIIGGSSITYLTPKRGFAQLLIPAYTWVFFSTLAGVFLFSVILNHDSFLFLAALTLLTSLMNVNLQVFVGKENIKLYNLFTILVPAFIIGFTLFFKYFFHILTINAYIYGYMSGQFVVFVLSWFSVRPYVSDQKMRFSMGTFNEAFHYGWRNEMSNFLQFLNYRLSYYFILYYIGLKSVGLFSVGIAISEAIWVICRSISTVQFAKLINTEDLKLSIQITQKSARVSIIASLFFVIIFLCIPSIFYKFIFGKEFTEVKMLFIFLTPGVLSLAFSNIYGHFFAARNELRVLIVKSFVGLVSTVILSVFFIPLWGLKGACIVTSISYISSSAYLIFIFYKNKLALRL